MEQYQRRILARSSPAPVRSNYDEDDALILKPVVWFVQATAYQVEAITSAILTCLSMAHESLQRAKEAKESAKEAVHAVPARAALVLRRMGFGFLGAAYVGLILVVVMLVAVILGVGLVRLWLEEPVFVREPLHFDYTDAHPSAVLSLRRMRGKKTTKAIPVGHTFYVSLVLILPESNFNRQIGVFQLTAEVISATGDIMATSNQPCMLRFRSFPVRLMRIFIMSIPFLMGVFSETQEIKVEILKYEGYKKTETIRIRLKPRAGTTALPELYAAEIVVNSQLPWRKELVHSWKWTFYVWSSLYVYIMLLIILVCCCKPIFFPISSTGDHNQSDQSTQVAKDQQHFLGGDVAISDCCSDTVRRWHRNRCNRKALRIRTWALPDPVGSSSSNIMVKEETSNVVRETGEAVTTESLCESC